MPIQVPKPTSEQLRAWYEDERMSARDIAAMWGCATTSIKNWLREYGIARRPKGVGLDNRGIVAPTKEELYHLVHVEHLSYEAIGARYGGVDKTAVMIWLKNHGISRPSCWDTRRKGNHPPEPTEEDLRGLYDAGVSLMDIGRMYGVSERTIQTRFERYGIATRTSGWKGGKRFTCNDGHEVMSLYEQRVCDWLSAHNVPHSYEPRLPFDRRSRADFLANGWYIEVWGVIGNDTYRQRRKRKVAGYKAHGLPLIEIPAHAFFEPWNDLWIRRLRKCLTTAQTSQTLWRPA